MSVPTCPTCKRELRRVGKRGDLTYYKCRRCGPQTRFEDLPPHPPGTCPECGRAGSIEEARVMDPSRVFEFRRFECECGYWWCE